MQRWEYLYVDYAENKAKAANGQQYKDWKRLSLPEYLNQMGNDGWEMIGAVTAVNWDYGRLSFKRAKP